MKGKKKISVIIPAHNEEKCIGSIISDLKKQDYPAGDFEIIVSDDYSDDNTGKIARKAGLRNLRVVEHKSKNVAAARNIGAKAAKGSMLVFIDADTRVYDRLFVKKIEEAFTSGKFSAFSVNIMVDPKEANKIDNILQKFFNWSVKMANKIGLFGSRGECQIVKKDVFFAVNGYNEKVAVAEDVELFKRIRRIAKSGFIDGITVYESARRYRKEGYFKTVSRWCYNGLYSFAFGKSLEKEWERVR